MKDSKIRMMAEIAVMVAFAFVLSWIKIVEMPQGGSVSLQMLPLFIIALRWGAGPGIISGVVYSLLKLLTPYVVHPAQLLLDYPLAFGAIGLAGLFKRNPLLGILAGGTARFLCHYVSGVVFFYMYAPEGMNVHLYSLLYNMSYMVPEMLLTILIAPQVIKRLQGKQHAADFRWGALKIASFVAPLMAIGVLFEIEKWAFISKAFVGVSTALIAYNLYLVFKSESDREKQLGLTNLFLMTVPPAIVIVGARLLDLL